MRASPVATQGATPPVLLCGDWLQCGPWPGSGRRGADWIWSGRVDPGEAMTDSKLQRLNMVESQVRPSDVTDRRIIKAMLEVPREKFVPAALASMAYMDEPLPVGTANGAGARYLLAPRTFAKLVQLADVGPEVDGARCRLCHRLFDGRAGQAGEARHRGGIRPGAGRARAAPAGRSRRGQCRRDAWPARGRCACRRSL